MGGGPGTNAIAIYNNLASPRLTHVQAIALAGGASNAFGVYNRNSAARDDLSVRPETCVGGTRCYGVYSEGGSPASLQGVTIWVSDASGLNVGVFSDTNSTTVLRECRVQAVKVLLGGASTAYGIQNSTSRPEVHHSILQGDTHPVSGSDPKVAHSQLVGPLVTTLGANTCLGAYDGGFAALSDTCQ